MNEQEKQELKELLLSLGVPEGLIDIDDLETGTRAAQAILSRIIGSKDFTPEPTVTDYIGSCLLPNGVMKKDRIDQVWGDK